MRNPFAPIRTPDDTYEPSSFSRRVAVPDTTDFTPSDLGTRAEGSPSTIVTVCTELGVLETRNEKRFSTGNHPVEMFVPLLHLTRAGFDVVIATPTGAPVALEEWAMPVRDEAVAAFRTEMDDALAHPVALGDLVADSAGVDDSIAAVFLPGGHGALLGLPEDPHLGRLLRAAHGAGRHVLSICHGPAGLLATADGDDFPFAGYGIAAFPDWVDRVTPYIGYMPGQLTWRFGAALRERGVEIVNRFADDAVHVDRTLVTGASPNASQPFGELAVRTLLGA